MTEHETSRTLVKSAPELWAECSEAASLARHLGAFGEIRITRLEPETTVAWEGTAASGTVRLEPSGWGTRVTLTLVQDEAAGPESPGTPDGPGTPEGTEAPDGVVPPEGVVPPGGTEAPEAPAAPEPEVGLEPAAEAEPPAASEAPAVAPAGEEEPGMAPRRPGVFARLAGVFRRRPAAAALVQDSEALPENETVVVDPVPESAAADSDPVAAAREPVAADPEPPEEHAEGELALAAALDSLGRAHHRPYSRA
ncbi:MAG TPA: hypothetical protein VFN87_01175 [Solirubrobacteraceae bacterium]|nr:hypothetical protein [Solirubrobacteraceae bacterium]